MVEIRTDQLHFTVPEATELLNDRLGLALAESDVTSLVSRTEGWAAGLQLAAMRLHDRADRSEFIARFSGADRHVVDYLGEEVLANQPPDMLDFLLRTSVLGRLCGPLCAAVTGRPDSAELLEAGYRANLFLIPLDAERHWFRYHQLFRDILRIELARTCAGRACRSCTSGPPGGTPAPATTRESIGHAIESGNVGADGRTDRHPMAPHVQRRRIADGRNLARRFAIHHRRRRRPAGGRAGLARHGLRPARRRRRRARPRRASLPVDGHLRMLRALHTYKTGDVARPTRQLAGVGPTLEPFLETVRRLITGVTGAVVGRFRPCQDRLSEAARLADVDGNRLATIYAQGCRALLAVIAGDLDAAAQMLTDAERVQAETVSDRHFVAMFPALARARLAAAQQDWQRALPAARTAAELAVRGAGRVEVAAAQLTLATAVRCAAALRSDESETVAQPGQGHPASMPESRPGGVGVAGRRAARRPARGGPRTAHRPRIRDPPIAAGADVPARTRAVAVRHPEHAQDASARDLPQARRRLAGTGGAARA